MVSGSSCCNFGRFFTYDVLLVVMFWRHEMFWWILENNKKKKKMCKFLFIVMTNFWFCLCDVSMSMQYMCLCLYLEGLIIKKFCWSETDRLFVTTDTCFFFRKMVLCVCVCYLLWCDCFFFFHHCFLNDKCLKLWIKCTVVFCCW